MQIRKVDKEIHNNTSPKNNKTIDAIKIVMGLFSKIISICRPAFKFINLKIFPIPKSTFDALSYIKGPISIFFFPFTLLNIKNQGEKIIRRKSTVKKRAINTVKTASHVTELGGAAAGISEILVLAKAAGKHILCWLPIFGYISLGTSATSILFSFRLLARTARVTHTLRSGVKQIAKESNQAKKRVLIKQLINDLDTIGLRKIERYLKISPSSVGTRKVEQSLSPDSSTTPEEAEKKEDVNNSLNKEKGADEASAESIENNKLFELQPTLEKEDVDNAVHKEKEVDEATVENTKNQKQADSLTPVENEKKKSRLLAAEIAKFESRLHNDSDLDAIQEAEKFLQTLKGRAIRITVFNTLNTVKSIISIVATVLATFTPFTPASLILAVFAATSVFSLWVTEYFFMQTNPFDPDNKSRAALISERFMKKAAACRKSAQLKWNRVFHSHSAPQTAAI